MASVTVWTSTSTNLTQTRVAALMKATRAMGDAHDSVTLAGQTVDETTQSLSNAFHRLVNLTMPDPRLHILAVIPLYESTATQQLQVLHDACASLKHQFTLHVLGLAPGIMPIFDGKTEEKEASDEFTKAVALLKQLSENATFNFTFSLVDDYAENGSPINFTMESFAHYIALIQIALMQDYYQILSPSLCTNHKGDNLAIGVASLEFDRSATSRQMLGLGFLSALDHVGINDSQVDAQKAATEAGKMLANINSRYPNLFEMHIRPLYMEEGINHANVAAKASPIIKNDIEALKQEILSLLTNQTLTLPEKEAVLALILGRDNERLRGMQYDHTGALLDDACEEPINLYVDAFNNHFEKSHLIPVRGDFKALKKYVKNPETNKREESPENAKALNPLPEIKRLKQEIMNDTSYIRNCYDELAALEKSQESQKDAEEIKKKWQKPAGNLKDIVHKEQPLNEKYTPPVGLTIKKSVDLRKFFTPVKNQMNLGSCTSFAAAAMYEAMLSQFSNAESPQDMSPAYLFYYSNVLKGRPAGGSNFHEQLEVLGTQGICRDDLYAYNSESPDVKPSTEADDDAKQHRVLQAKQIPLVNYPEDKPKSIEENHKLLTSALSEGYPVGISLNVYDNLGTDGAFVVHPQDAPNAKEDGWHAMVLVGYAEENNCYIVRNSWGPEFGDKGYCYMPSTYIDDPDYMDFACIITEISDAGAGARADAPTELADFAGTEREIKRATIRNAIAKVKVRVDHHTKLYKAYYRYYQQLVMDLIMPGTQKAIREAAQVAQEENCRQAQEKHQQLINAFPEKFKDYKKGIKIYIFIAFLVASGLGFWWCLKQNATLLILFGMVATLFAFGLIGYKWWVKSWRRKYESTTHAAVSILHQNQQSLLEMQIRYHVAGMWLTHFHSLSNDLGVVYDRLESYNVSLHAWQTDYSGKIEAPEQPEAAMFRRLDPSPLLTAFFDAHRQAIVSRVDLVTLFESFQANPDTLEASHQQLETAVTSQIDTLLADFNMANFLLGDNVDYLPPVNLPNEMSVLMNVGQPSYRNPAMNATPCVRIMLADVDAQREGKWKVQISPLFPTMPTLLPYHNSTALVLISIHPQSVDAS